MGASLLLLGVAGFLVYTFIQSLPQRDLHRLIPGDVEWVIHANPAALTGQDDLGRAATGALSASPWIESLHDAGVTAADIHEAALVGTASGQTAVLIRRSGLGASHVALPDKSDLVLVTLDEDTIALGSSGLTESIAAVARGDEGAAAMSVEDTRLIGTLRASGPLWAWLPNPAGAAVFLGNDVAGQTAAAGASIAPGERLRVDLRLHTKSVEEAARLETHLDQLRAQAAATGVTDVALSRALRDLIREMRREATVERKQRLDTIDARIASTVQAKTSSMPAIASLESAASAWTLQRDGTRTTLSAELATPAVGPLLLRLGGALP